MLVVPGAGAQGAGEVEGVQLVINSMYIMGRATVIVIQRSLGMHREFHMAAQGVPGAITTQLAAPVVLPVVLQTIPTGVLQICPS